MHKNQCPMCGQISEEPGTCTVNFCDEPDDDRRDELQRDAFLSRTEILTCCGHHVSDHRIVTRYDEAGNDYEIGECPTTTLEEWADGIAALAEKPMNFAPAAALAFVAWTFVYLIFQVLRAVV